MGFDVKVDYFGIICVVRVYGCLDLSTTTRFDACISDLIERGKTKIAVDFENCDYIDSEGVKILINAYRSIRDKGRMIICGAHGPVLNVFQILGMNVLFQIIPSLDHLI